MKIPLALLLVGTLAAIGCLLAWAPSRADEVRVAQAAGPASAELVARGRGLFNDVGLSADRRWSCATCHPNEGHTDNKTYVGVTVVADGCRGVNLQPGDSDRAFAEMREAGCAIVNSSDVR